MTLHLPARARFAAACVAACAAACANVPTLMDLPSAGGSDDAPTTRVREGEADRTAANNVAAGWESVRPAPGTPVLYGRDGSPVGSATPGAVTRTPEPLDDGVDQEAGSRMVLLDLYDRAVEERDELLLENEALQTMLEQAETRSKELDQRLATLQEAYDALSTEKQDLEASRFDLAARLATAQIGRLEAERALLEATLEWRKLNALNNAPLDAAEGGR